MRFLQIIFTQRLALAPPETALKIMKPNTNTETAETVQTTDSPAVVQERLVMPLDLWLQWHGDGDPEDDGEVCESEVTWSREKIFDGDVEYVHADEIRRALGGHRCSLLWSDTGLIAANMRCVEAIGKLEALYENMDPNGFFARKIAAILGHNAGAMARGLAAPDSAATTEIDG